MQEKEEKDHPYTIIRGWGLPKDEPKEKSSRESASGARQEPPAPGSEPGSQSSAKSQETVALPPRPADELTPKKPNRVPVLFILIGLLVVMAVVFMVWMFNRPGVRITGTVPAMTDATENTNAAAVAQRFSQTVKDNSPIYFIPDQEYWVPEEEQKLDLILRAMSGFKKVSLAVTGHTANDNKPAAEAILSLKRADMVKNYLMEKAKTLELSIETIGKGATEPAVKDAPINEQQANRRVEIRVESAE